MFKNLMLFRYESIDFAFDFGTVNASIPIYYQEEYNYTGYLNISNEPTVSGVYIDETGTWRHYSYNNFSISSLWNADSCSQHLLLTTSS